MITFAQLIFIHIVLGLLIQNLPIINSLHAWITLMLGIYFAFNDQNSNRCTITIFYITGSELLWRGFKANINWEFGKYSILIIIFSVLWRMGPQRIKNKIGLIYVLLLIPSFIALEDFIRQDISHAIAGPLCLGFGLLLFQNQTIIKQNIINYLVALLLPIISLISILILSTLQFGQIDFYASYIYEYTTAGIGPNQASNILGLGILISFLLFILDNKSRFIYLVLLFILIFQTIITYSRGGFWNAIISVGIAALFSLISKNDIRKFVITFSLISSIFYFLLLPIIDDLSQQSITTRYGDTEFDRRGSIIESEIHAFRHNKFFGIGPGESRKYRIKYFNSPKHTHTEYSRLLAEHGIFGIVLIFLLISLLIKAFKNKTGISRSISLSLATWSLLFMFHSATRLVAPSMIFSFAMANIYIKEKDSSKD